MVLVFIMDPIERINIRGDSTFVLMLESQARGHEVLYAETSGLELEGGAAYAVVRQAKVRRVEGAHYTLGDPRRIRLDDAAAVFMRKDPPFDIEYLASTYILDRVDSSRVVMINDPRALRDANEKLFALNWAHLMPKTIVARAPSRIRAFIDEIGDVVVKPLTGAGGSGVIRLQRGDKNIGAILDLMTLEGRVAITAQAYLREVTEGDRRIILIAGEPAGVVNRVASASDLRSNMHVGGQPQAARLSDRDLEICGAIGPELLRRGLIFVGIDVIGGRLTEINVTSPTGLQEIDRFDGVNLEGRIIDWVEQKLAQLRASARVGIS
jgi:glutathione synthase